MQDTIDIRGARTHNLKDIHVQLPRHKLVVITGLSGSGKSSLAFDTLYAEGQRRYVESLSAYARQFLSMMEKPDVDAIEGLSPAIAIEQKSTSHNPRSTVGTVTEIYDYLRLLYARAGEPRCPEHARPLKAQTISQMVDGILALPSESRWMLLAPVVSSRKGEYEKLFDEFKQKGFLRVRLDGKIYELDSIPPLDAKKKHSIEVVIDRFRVREDMASRLTDSLETTLTLSGGLALVRSMEEDSDQSLLFSSKFACPLCNYSLSELEPRLFSFNSPMGACPTCDGLGVQEFFDPHKVVHDPALPLTGGAIAGWDVRHPLFLDTLKSLSKHYQFDLDTPFENLSATLQHIILHGSGDDPITFKLNLGKRTQTERKPFEGVLPSLERRYHHSPSQSVKEELAQFIGNRACPDCDGTRLRLEARHVYVSDKSLPSLTALPIQETCDFLKNARFDGQAIKVATPILREITARLGFLIEVGLEYLTLTRSADTLSGGEAQRIRLASQIGSGLVGVMYVLDEPSIGLHPRDNARLLKSLLHLKNLGNSVIVIEHDAEAIRTADFVVDMGPGAGKHGGEVVAIGTPEDILQHETSLTGQYLSGKLSVATPKKHVPVDLDRVIRLTNAHANNLKNITVDIPIGVFTCITGVSGSGKSSLINDTLAPFAAHRLNGATAAEVAVDSITGFEHLDKVVNIDQSPIGRTPRSNPATYTGLLTHIRELFSATPEARARGYQMGRFSFNVKGGRCEACQGEGVIRVEMHFLADVYVTCDVCQGGRFNRATLEIHYKGKTIQEVLDMTVEEARVFFDAIPPAAHKLQMLVEVGLSYIQLGQNATTLSGGEAQRIKLAKELSRRDTGKTLYILDEPTTGLHFHDVKMLLKVLHHLRERGNTIVVIEHNLDVIKTADWVIDLGPEGGNKGGEVVAVGTPEKICTVKRSYTGQFLQKIL